MFRRLLSRPENAPETDQLDVAVRVLRAARPQERSEEALKGLRGALGGDARGYVVRGDDASGYAFDAQVGYGAALLEIAPGHGPWRSPGPRVVANHIAEMFTPNDAAKRAQYSDLGLRDATSTLVVPVAGGYAAYGALVMHRHGGPAFGDEELRLATRWGALLGEAQAQALELRRSKLSLVEFTRAFTQAFEAQDFAQLGHAERVTAYALALGRALGLPAKQQADLYFAAMLHDIGKLGSGLDLRLEDLEHPQRGANMVASAAMLKEAAEGIRHHHEAWDGSGFPSGLRKDAIPLLARIVAVADTFDVLSSERGQALPLREVEKALEARSGGELDPSLVSLFVGNILRQGKDTAELGTLQATDLPF
ncbi:MAG TPA: HD domain-containing phosphohydrolase [Trueperaceae bacterium]